MTIPFVGGSRKTSKDAYQYPLGYIFGTSKFYGASAVVQSYFGNSTSYLTNSTYYIPDSLKKVTVTGGEILRGAFYGCKGLTSVTIESGVTSIGNWAFFDCSGLTSINIPDSVTSIGEGAFSGTAYYKDESHWDDSGVLYICNQLIEAKDTISAAYTIRAGTKTIANYAFYDCYGMTSITIPDSVTSIGDGAFSGCSGLTGDLKIPDSVTVIGDNAFEFCSGLKSVTIGNGVTTIGNRAFQECSGLTGTLKVPDSVISIGNYAFSGCSGLTGTLKVPDSVTSIGNYAFYKCNKLTSVTIGSDVASIGDYVFNRIRDTAKNQKILLKQSLSRA